MNKFTKKINVFSFLLITLLAITVISGCTTRNTSNTSLNRTESALETDIEIENALKNTDSTSKYDEYKKQVKSIIINDIPEK